MSLHIDIQNACTGAVPANEDIRRWITAALGSRDVDTEICVRLVDEEEMTLLNEQYRDKQGSTNVLSFPAGLPADIEHPLLGDIVICPSVVVREAAQQNKQEQQHWAHMLVHGSLHLLGYDHLEEREATRMESMETTILQSLGWPCPYTGATAEVTLRRTR
jgi:probable rRNA maturation factor